MKLRLAARSSTIQNINMLNIDIEIMVRTFIRAMITTNINLTNKNSSITKILGTRPTGLTKLGPGLQTSLLILR